MSNEVCVLALCESEMLVLRPNQLYRFKVMPGCKRCKELEALFEWDDEIEDNIQGMLRAGGLA